MTQPSQCDLILGRLRAEGRDADGWVSTLILGHHSGSLAVHSRIAELRARGYTIERTARTVRSRRGPRRIHYYRLAPTSTRRRVA